MTTAVDSLPLSGDRIQRVLEERQGPDLRFRQAMITSAAIHTAVSVLLVLAPLFLTTPTVVPEFTPVQIVQLAPPEPPPPAPEEQPAAATPAPEPEPEEPEPEPEETAPEDPEETLDKEKERNKEKTEEELARERAEEERRRKEEEARRRAEEERRRREAEERRKREEEERRRQPQKASRRATEPDRELPQVSTRQGQIGVQGGEQARGLTAEEFEFAWYLESMLNKIRARWSPPPRGPYARERKVVVQFRIDSRGRIVAGPDVITSSGSTVYDRAALSAIRNAEPYPPLPTLYQNPTLGVHLAFTQ